VEKSKNGQQEGNQGINEELHLPWVPLCGGPKQSHIQEVTLMLGILNCGNLSFFIFSQIFYRGLYNDCPYFLSVYNQAYH
jgi:hypothetical protein